MSTDKFKTWAGRIAIIVALGYATAGLVAVWLWVIQGAQHT